MDPHTGFAVGSTYSRMTPVAMEAVPAMNRLRMTGDFLL